VKESRSRVRKQAADPPGNRIRKKVWIKAPPEVVFSALTDPKQLSRWFCDRASCDPREGGELLACWKTEKSSREGRAVFTRFTPCQALDLHWIDDGDGPQAGRSEHKLSYEIRLKSGLTEVAMLDADESIPDEETFDLLNQGWNSVLMELKDYCERKVRSLKRRSGKDSPPDEATGPPGREAPDL